MSRSLSGTPLEKMLEAIRFSEDNRVRAIDQTRALTDKAARELTNRKRAQGLPPPSRAEIDTVADDLLRSDPIAKVAVDNEQWGYRLTTMYALQELVAEQAATRSLLGELVREVKTLNKRLSDTVIETEVGA